MCKKDCTVHVDVMKIIKQIFIVVISHIIDVVKVSPLLKLFIIQCIFHDHE